MIKYGGDQQDGRHAVTEHPAGWARKAGRDIVQGWVSVWEDRDLIYLLCGLGLTLGFLAVLFGAKT